MQKKIKIYHVQDWKHYSKWVKDREVVKRIEDADLVFWEGGSDVSPHLYGENVHPTTSSDYKRDMYEQEVYNLAQRLGKKCWGTCRGIQFLAVMNGSKLIQHQENPNYYHDFETYDGNKFEVTSTHHQSCSPYNLSKEDYKILGWTNGISKFHYNGEGEEVNPEKECEVLYFPKTNCLGFQGHLESMYRKSPTITWANELLTKFLNEEL